tara:strand:- start:987 stop:1283 length:297 start_codon:yes stop_codon:yes gene_type:complete
VTTNIRSAFLVGSGVLLDITTSVTVADTRIRSIHSTGSGIYIMDGTSTTALNSKAGNIIKWDVCGTTYLDWPDLGIRVNGLVSVTAPTSTATLTVFYG